MSRLTPPTRRPTGRIASAQRGMTLIFALITMLALSLAAVALIRAVDTGTGVLGNLGFKRDALLATDTAMRTAIGWVQTRAGKVELDTDSPAGIGYFASYFDRLDAIGHSTDPQRTAIDWDGDGCAAAKSNGVAVAACIQPSASFDVRNGAIKARYVVERLCSQPGNMTTVTGMVCAKPMSVTETVSVRGKIDYNTLPPPGLQSLQQFFRITVRTEGARNATSLTETIVHF
jgi:type IV pilus assembly protein PilX